MSAWTSTTETKRLVRFRGVWVDPAAVVGVRLRETFGNYAIEVHLDSGTTIDINSGQSLPSQAEPVLDEFMQRLTAGASGVPEEGR